MYVGWDGESGWQYALRDWSAMAKELPRITMRYGIGRNERPLQTHEFDLVRSCYLPFPLASQQSSGCPWAAVSDRD